jgi:hypothetical protein
MRAFATSISKEGGKDDMNHMAGSFAGNITQQSALALTVQPDHAMNIAEDHGIRKSSDPLWSRSKMTHWGVTDLLKGKGTQHGYHHDNHAGAGSDWGTF